jgi:hypothetical protein
VQKTQVQLDRDELLILNNALNEVANGIGIGDSEFSTRLGFERDEVAALLARVGQVVDSMPQSRAVRFEQDSPRGTQARLRLGGVVTCRGRKDSPEAERLSLSDAYIAMYYFVDAYWRRGGRADGNVALLTHGLQPSADPTDDAALQTADPAFWSDWLAAVERARADGLPKNS